ncbi:MAG: oligosaccharide flippase family protein [bacterium]|nr:oligosaccharide flippase family protein [bacterium]
MEHFPKIIKNTLAQLFGRGGVILATIITTSVLTRVLGVSGYGNYVFIIALVMFFVAIADWGSSLIFVRETSKSGFEEEKFFGNAFIFRFLFALLTLFLINFLLLFAPFSKNLTLSIQVASLLLLLISLKTSSYIIFQTKLRFEYLALTDIVISFAFLGLLFFFGLLSHLPLTLEEVVVFLTFSNLAGTILALFLARKMAKIDFTPNFNILKRISAEILPTGALLLTFSIYNRLDVLLLQFFKGAEPVGIYGLAYKVHDNLVLGSAYLTSALFPILATVLSKTDGLIRLRTIYKKTFDLLLFAGIAVFLLIYFLAPFIITVIGGPSFAQSSFALRILIFATLLAYLNHLTGYTLIALGKQRISLIVAVTALFCNLGLNYIFIPRYSFVAAAIITIATEGLVLLITSIYLAKKYSLYPSLSFPKTIFEVIRTKGKIY